MRNIKYGGTIVPGDFIAISNNNHMDFGWYAGNGRGTLQYYSFRGPGNTYEQYQEWLNTPESQRHKWVTERYKKGFTTKCLWKSYINAVHSTRVLRISNPEEIFTEPEDMKSYQKSKETLITLNLIKQ